MRRACMHRQKVADVAEPEVTLQPWMYREYDVNVVTRVIFQ
jgi:hypothetical protein